MQSQKAQRNAILPIFRLPPEVLVLIFKACRDGDIDTIHSTYIRELPEHSWMECSRVCQRWRHIIFGTPSLWTDTIVSQGWPKPSASDLSRADRISLEATFQSTLTSFLRGFRFSSTILKTIELTVTIRKEDDVVPLGLLLHNFPALERISLYDCLVNWKPPPLPSHSLKSMKILMNDHEMEGRDSMEFSNATDASEFLRNTPSLEALTLIYGFPCRYHQDTGTDKIIELPCLRDLDLGEGGESWCSYFFGRLKVPSESMSRVRLSLYDNSVGSNYDPIWSCLQRRFHDVDVSSGYLELLNAAELRRDLHLSWSICWKVHTRVISSEAASVEAPIQSDPGTERHTDLFFQSRNVHKEMLLSYEACGALPLLFVRVLVIERADARLWEILAERFPSITSITCLSERPILHSSTNGNTISSIAPVRAFPKLASLELRKIPLQVEASAASVEVLKWLRMRKEAGVPVERLVSKCCHPCDTWLAAARGIVEHVEVVECNCYDCRYRQRVTVE